MIRLALPFLLLAALGLSAVPKSAHGCAPAPPPGGRVDIADETALIVWDEANKVEHFIRRASFQATAYDFGFLVPTPNQPELAEASEEVFKQLQILTAPRIEVRRVFPSIGCASSSASKSAAMAENEVMVLQQKRVGDFDAVVLSATNADALAGWLREHAYAYSPTLAKWLEPYVRDRWTISAFRIAAPPKSKEAEADEERPGKLHGLRSSPVRMSFKTDKPFYPYREPEEQRDASASQAPRLLRVYFAGAQRFAGRLGDGARAWPGKTMWSNALEADSRQNLLTALKMPAETQPSKWTLTEFEDHSTPRPGTDEVYFSPAADQSAVERPPIIQTIEDPSAAYTALSVCCGLPAVLAGAYLLWRLLRSR